MRIFEKDVNELVEYWNNPRNNDDAVEKVAESIKEFGFKVPIILDKNNVIVAGHTRLKASILLGLKTVPCIIAEDLTDEKIKAFRLVDNKVAELAEWDFGKLEEEKEKLSTIELELFGFGDEDEVRDWSEFFEETEPKDKEPKTAVCPHCGQVTEI